MFELARNLRSKWTAISRWLHSVLYWLFIDSRWLHTWSYEEYCSTCFCQKCTMHWLIGWDTWYSSNKKEVAGDKNGSIKRERKSSMFFGRFYVCVLAHACAVNFSCLTGKCNLTLSHELHWVVSKKDTAEQSAGSNLFLEICSSKLYKFFCHS